MIFLLENDIVRRSARRSGLPSGPISIASASSQIRILQVCLLRLRGLLAATNFSEPPPGNRRDVSVFLSPLSVSSAERAA